jgi:outer membrane receptor for ferrienterochelin and colicins
MIKYFIILYLLAVSVLIAQNNIKIIVKDGETREPLPGANVFFDSLNKGTITEISGMAIIKNIPPGRFKLTIKFIGYKSEELNLLFSDNNEFDTTIFLNPDVQKYAKDVLVYSTRNNGVISNSPLRIEVLGQEEVNEELVIRPGNISKLLGETSGIQVQQTSAVSGNVTFRLMGLPGGYTQLLKDGFPVFTGFSSGLSLLQIPPLDLQQVEVIKGSLSTLYGSGPIAGVINLISKGPTRTHSWDIILNQTNRKGTDIGSFYSNTFGNIGFTFLVNQSFQSPVDLSGSGFTDIPRFTQTSIFPKLFYSDKSISVLFGVSAFIEDRKGGDLTAIQNGADSIHNYTEENKTRRYYTIFSLTKTFENNDQLTLKNSISYYSRDRIIKTSAVQGRQNYIYSELSYLNTTGEHSIVSGITSTQDNFHSDSINGYNLNTIGVFLQDDWKMSEVFIMQPGLRIDYNNKLRSFLLPHLSILANPGGGLSFRIGGGYGYRIPAPVLTSEKSRSLNFDFSYVTVFNEFVIKWNQAFFYAVVDNPVFETDSGTDVNTPEIKVKGFDTNLIISLDEISLFADYSWNDTRLSLTPKHKLNLTLTAEEEKEWRGGIEAFYTGRQYLPDNRLTTDYWTFGIMVEKLFAGFSVIGNIEDIFNVKQSNWERTVNPPINNPTFNPVWAPLEGVNANVAIHIHI